MIFIGNKDNTIRQYTMADFNDNSHKGFVLMTQALKKYEEGDFEGGDKDREEANRYFDLASMEMNSDEGKLAMLYGESRNFGVMYNVFEQNIENLIKTKEGKQVIKEGYNLIKNNKVLNEQFKIYDFFENAKSGMSDPSDFVGIASNMIGDFSRKSIVENNEKFIFFIKRNKLNEYVDISEDDEKLYEAIEYMILNKKGINNTEGYVNAKEVICEHIRMNNNSLTESKTNEELFNGLKKSVETEEQKLEESLNDDEKTLLRQFTSGKSNKRKIFENYKNTTLSKITEAIRTSDDEHRKSWNNIYETVSSKKYSDDVMMNITNCAEMLEICDTLDN